MAIKAKSTILEIPEKKIILVISFWYMAQGAMVKLKGDSYVWTNNDELLLSFNLQ